MNVKILLVALTTYCLIAQVKEFAHASDVVSTGCVRLEASLVPAHGHDMSTMLGADTFGIAFEINSLGGAPPDTFHILAHELQLNFASLNDSKKRAFLAQVRWAIQVRSPTMQQA